MPDRVTDHAVYASAVGQLMGAVEVFQGLQGNLAGSRSRSDGRIGEGAAFPESEDSRGKSDFAHWHGNQVAGPASQSEEAEAVAQGFGMCGNFLGIRFSLGGRRGGFQMGRHAPEIVQREQSMRRQPK